jgi:acyl carrier protein
MDDLERRVVALVATKAKTDPATITLDSTLDALGVDSLDAADLLFTFEDTFHIVIPDEAAQNMKNVRQIVDALRPIVASPDTDA